MLRRGSTFVWLGWLLVQLCALAAPLAASQLADASRPLDAESLCVCPMGDDPACPMHAEAARHASETRHDDAATCTVRSTCTPLEYAVLSLQITAVLPDGVALARDARTTALHFPSTSSSSRSDLPDLPPPRA
ncbi:MAG: hypothetical protein AB7Q29_17045 [Vicinamibacterales bacterium]